MTLVRQNGIDVRELEQLTTQIDRTGESFLKGVAPRGDNEGARIAAGASAGNIMSEGDVPKLNEVYYNGSREQ